MASAGYATLQLIPSLKGVQATVDKELGGVGASGDKAGANLGSRMSGALGGVLKKSVIGIGVAAGGALGTALFSGFTRLNAIEQATAKLTGLGNSAASVKTIMDNALAAVKGTAFGLDEAATVAASSVAAGIKPGKELQSTLRLVADAATIGGSSLSDMGQIFNKVATSNKVQAEVINQLNEQGIPIVQFLAKSLHTTTDEVLGMSRAGSISFPIFAKAMQEGLGGAALASGNTTTGAFKNMRAALSRFGAALLTGVFPIAKQVFGGITTFLDKLTASVGPFVTRFLNFFTDLRGPVMQLVAGLTLSKSAAATFGDSLGGLVLVGANIRGFLEDFATTALRIGKQAGPALAAALQLIIDHAVTFAQTVGPPLLGALRAVATFVADKLLPSLTNLWNFLSPTLIQAWNLFSTITRTALVVALKLIPPVLDRIGTALVAVTGFMNDHKTAIKIVALAITALFIPALIRMGVQALISGGETVAIWTLMQASAIRATIISVAQFAIQGAKWVWLGIVALASAAQVALAWLISLGPIALVVAAVVGLVVAIVLNWERIKNAIVTAATFVFDWLKANWPIILAILTGPIGLAVLVIVRHWTTIKDGVTAVKDWIVEKFNNVVDFVTGLPGRIATAANGMWDGIKNAFKDSINWIIRAWNGLDFSIPGVDTHIPGVGKVGGFTLGTPDIPELARGAIIKATPGGTLIRAAEGGRDEIVGPLDEVRKTLGSGPSLTQNVFPTPGMSEQQVASISARQLMFLLANA